MMMLRIAVITMPLLCVALFGCARPPRPPAAAEQAERPRTRTSIPVPAPTTPSTVSAEADASAACTVALQLPGTLLDCSFESCPRRLLNELLTGEDLALERGRDGIIGVVARRPSPPHTRRLATLVTTSDGLKIRALEDGATGACRGLTPEQLEGPVEGVSVRRSIPGEELQAR